MLKIYFYLFISIVLLDSCGSSDAKETEDNHSDPYAIHELPEDLSNLPDETLQPILEMIGDAQIIGMTEGTHGMNEPLDFRNSLIKFLVREKRIDVIAFESGMLRSRMLIDYVLGGEGNLDSVVANGFQPFAQLRQNKELVAWLREYNSDETNDHKVKLYGFDIPGVPTNPAIGEIDYGLNEALKYFKEVDPEEWKYYNDEIEPLLPYLRVAPASEEDTRIYWDLDQAGKDNIASQVQGILDMFTEHKETYLSRSTIEDYNWALQAIIGARHIINFLECATFRECDYSAREKAMFENIQWINTRENNPRMLLFAHLAHLTKDIFFIDQDSNYVESPNMLGEYLGEEFYDDYVVIGNFYESLYFPDDTAGVAEYSIDHYFNTMEPNNFYLQLDKNDTTFTKDWNFGKRSLSGSLVEMNVVKGIDIVLFNRFQHYFEEK